MNQPSLTSAAWGLLLLLGLIWGASFLSIRIALDEVPFLTSVAYRVFLAALLLWGWVWWRGLDVPFAAWWAFLVMGLLNNVIPFCLMAWGQLHIESGLTSVFNAATAIFGALVAALLLPDEKLTIRKSIGIALGFAGVVMAIGMDALTSFNITSIAQLAVVAGTLSYAFASVWARVRLAGVAPEVNAAGMLTASSVIMIPLALAFDGPTQAVSGKAVVAIAYYVIFATAGAYLLYFKIIEMAGAANTMLVTLIVPPVAIFLGAWVLGEQLSTGAYAGLGLLAAGLIVLDGRLLRRG